MSNTTQILPLLPLREVVVFPHMVIPLFIGRKRSMAALDAAMASDKKIYLVAQREATVDHPNSKDLFQVGVIANILQLLKLPDGTLKLLVEGVQRAEVGDIEVGSEFDTISITPIEDQTDSRNAASVDSRQLLERFDRYVSQNKKIPNEVVATLNTIDSFSQLLDTISSHMTLGFDRKQEVLEAIDLDDRHNLVSKAIDQELGLAHVEKQIRGRVKKQMEKSQREYYLNEQMKAIQKELGDGSGKDGEFEALVQKIEESGMPTSAKEKADSELKKLKMMAPMSAEASVVRGYLDWMTSVPWKKRTKVSHNLSRAQQILDKDHYGLEEVKERIIEFLAVQKRVKKVKGPVLCLVGPPGVGKTSLAESIARATNRKYVRMALGGVRDESEIRGHRRTYIGSMPGKLVQKLSKAGVKNPLFLLDEIDKMGMDHRGDPASALLEVLDPEQNNAFSDHYLEVDYDLSDVMFICTSNSMNIPGPLLDRMEVIRIPGYTEDEKLAIADRYLLPKQLKRNGLKQDELKVSDDAMLTLIRHYTREAGVRGLEREIAKLCRKAVTKLSLTTEISDISVEPEQLEEFVGVQKTDYGRREKEDAVGLVTGLAWTSVGGELLSIEAAALEGKGGVIKTGQLGDVMQESIQAAHTVIRARAQSLGISAWSLANTDIHIHVPEGATPKDGPSAGIAMCTAFVSVLSGIPVCASVAMTGEITLRGQVLPIGGLKEKLLAARRGGIEKVLIPIDNVRDLKEVPDKIKNCLDIVPVSRIEEVLEHALKTAPKALSDEEFRFKPVDNQEKGDFQGAGAH